MLKSGTFTFFGLTGLTSTATSESWATGWELHCHIYFKRSTNTSCFGWLVLFICLFHLVYFFSLSHHRISMSTSGGYSSSNGIWALWWVPQAFVQIFSTCLCFLFPVFGSFFPSFKLNTVTSVLSSQIYRINCFITVFLVLVF